jgi:hypothetical protein
MASRVAVYTLRIMGPELKHAQSIKAFDERNQEVVDNLAAGLEHAIDALNDYLPEGYYAKVDDA